MNSSPGTIAKHPQCSSPNKDISSQRQLTRFIDRATGSGEDKIYDVALRAREFRNSH
jgi:hypothetical protein